MTSFFKKSILFSSPIIIIIVLIELFITLKPNSFNTKAKFINNNKDIEVLILGSSHNMTAINPEFISKKTANLAYNMQDIEIDSALFFNYVPSLKNLKILIIEMGYHSLIRRNNPDYFRYPWYYKHHNTTIKNLSFLNKSLMYSSSPSFFNNYIWNYLNPYTPNHSVSKYGFVHNNNSNSLFKELNYDDELINKDLKKRKKHILNIPEKNHYFFNKSKIDKMVNYCNNNNISVIFLSTPTYKSYYKNYNQKVNKKRINYTDSIINHNKTISYLNFEQDIKFKVTRFKDDDHLNPIGAMEFTIILNQKIDSIYQFHFNPY